MPRIFDNIAISLLPALQDTLRLSERADFCVGYFNLRGWKLIDSFVETWRGGDGSCCRLLVGMQPLPHEELRSALSLMHGDEGIDQQTALRLKKHMAEEFREQLTLGAPTNEDETGLRRLSAQIKARQVVVKLFLRHPLHAKLYLLHRTDPNNPTVGFVGSSNLTLAGLSKQGELNVGPAVRLYAQRRISNVAPLRSMPTIPLSTNVASNGCALPSSALPWQKTFAATPALCLRFYNGAAIGSRRKTSN